MSSSATPASWSASITFWARSAMVRITSAAVAPRPETPEHEVGDVGRAADLAGADDGDGAGARRSRPRRRRRSRRGRRARRRPSPAVTRDEWNADASTWVLRGRLTRFDGRGDRFPVSVSRTLARRDASAGVRVRGRRRRRGAHRARPWPVVAARAARRRARRRCSPGSSRGSSPAPRPSRPASRSS